MVNLGRRIVQGEMTVTLAFPFQIDGSTFNDNTPKGDLEKVAEGWGCEIFNRIALIFEDEMPITFAGVEIIHVEQVAY